MSGTVEIELKFLVPAASRAALAAELDGRGNARRAQLTADYLDTPDLRLARAGLAWRVRREAGRWVQALKCARGDALERFEHEVVRPDATPDAAAHADTAPGRQLIDLLDAARADGLEAGVRFRSQVRRLERRVRTRGAVVDIALDEGRLLASGAVLRLREVEFELVSGSPVAMLALVERWRQRFGLILDPRNKAERGFALAAGWPDAPLRKAASPSYDKRAGAGEAFSAVLDECLAHLMRSAIGLADGDAAQAGEHVHQLRVAIRRLRSALRAFEGWVAAPPAELVDGLRVLFAALGQARDRDVLGSGVAAELARAGAPPLPLPGSQDAVDPAALVRAADTQRLLLGWVTWRAGLPAEAETETEDALRRLARRRLRRWHERMAAGGHAFDELDDAALHALRKRVKRQRYAIDFLAPLLPRQSTARHVQALSAAQSMLGEIHDLIVARDRYQALVGSAPAAWFAVGWLTARIATARAGARDELARLAALLPLGRRG
ncbi:CHAD domain-containing protein [Roseateles sp. BYS78W]|uniref:CHAD domain-containing protein n=1 Tax=Pelomonas candidula TaxID=3299025 RepID=A0ABW7H919_9BURK